MFGRHFRYLEKINRQFKADQSGSPMLEFALAFPFLMGFGTVGVDLTRFSIAHMKISQITLNLADNVSRMGVINASSAVTDLRELDVNNAFLAVQRQGAPLGLTTNGRVILSSLETSPSTAKNSANQTFGQRIHWQRCLGMKGEPPTGGAPDSFANYRSSYGEATPFTTAGTTTATTDWGFLVTTASGGIGDAGTKVNAPGGGSGVMFVEINYEFKPLFRVMFDWVAQSGRIHYVASYITRDNRGYINATTPPIIKNPAVVTVSGGTAAAPVMSCNRYTSSVS